MGHYYSFLEQQCWYSSTTVQQWRISTHSLTHSLTHPGGVWAAACHEGGAAGVAHGLLRVCTIERHTLRRQLVLYIYTHTHTHTLSQTVNQLVSEVLYFTHAYTYTHTYIHVTFRTTY